MGHEKHDIYKSLLIKGRTLHIYGPYITYM